MTYGYGDSPDGWRTPPGPDPAGRGRRRAYDPDDDRDGHDGTWPAPERDPFPGADRRPHQRGSAPGGHSTGGHSTGGHSTGGHSTGGHSTGGRATVPGGRAFVPGSQPPGSQAPGGRASVPGGYPAGGRDPGSGHGPAPGGYSAGGRASVPGPRPPDPGVYHSGGRGERRPPAGPEYPPASVPPPPQYRPSWPSRSVPEAEPSWPNPGGHEPGGQEPGDDRWPGRGGPDGGAYGRPASGPGRADPQRPGSGRAGVAAPDRATAPVYGGGRAASRGRAGRDGDRLPSKLWMSILGGVVAVALVAVGVTGTLFMISDNGSGPASAHAGRPKHDISNQQVDPKPLTTAEVFPAATITPNPAGPAYQVIKSEETANCGTGAVGDLATLMTSQGCTQLVRAAVVSPDKTYVITTGIFNLRDKAGAEAADNAIEASIGAKKGRFPGLAAGSGTDVIAQAATQLGWDHEGHFLVYCVVARGDGKPIDASDQAATKIINDLVEVDLKGTVIADRISPRPSPTGTAAPSHK